MQCHLKKRATRSVKQQIHKSESLTMQTLIVKFFRRRAYFLLHLAEWLVVLQAMHLNGGRPHLR